MNKQTSKRHIFVFVLSIIFIVSLLSQNSLQKKFSKICMKKGTILCVQGISKEIGDLQVKTFFDETNHIWQLVKPKTFKETRSFSRHSYIIQAFSNYERFGFDEIYFFYTYLMILRYQATNQGFTLQFISSAIAMPSIFTTRQFCHVLKSDILRAFFISKKNIYFASNFLYFWYIGPISWLMGCVRTWKWYCKYTHKPN